MREADGTLLDELFTAVTGEIGLEAGPVPNGAVPLPDAHGTEPVRLPLPKEKGGVVGV